MKPTTEEAALQQCEGIVKTLAYCWQTPLLPREDLEQEGRLAVLRAYTCYDKTRGVSLPTFACGYIKNHFRHLLRDQNSVIYRASQVTGLNVESFSFHEWASPCYNPYPEIDNRLEVESALSVLSPMRRRIIEMHYRDGFTISEIADRLGITEDSASGRCRQAMQQLQNPTLAVYKPLTRMETTVLLLLAEDLTAVQIADRLCLNKRTVDMHKLNLYKKLGVKSILQAYITAVKRGLLPPLLPGEE